MISLRHKLWLGFGGLLLILLSVSFLSVIVLTAYSHTLERVFHENYNSAVYCDKMRDALDRLNLRSQLLIWSPGDSSSIDATAQQATFEQNLANQQANCTLSGEADHTTHLADLWGQYKLSLAKFETDSGVARSDLYRSSLLPLYRDMKKTAQWIANANMSNMVSVDGQVKRTLTDVRTALLVLVIAGTLAAAIVVGAAGRSILRPLRSLTSSARQIAAGNLDMNLNVPSSDEIGQLAEAFNSMTANLREFRRIDHHRLLRTQQTTQLAIDSLPDAVCIIGPNEQVEISNRAACDLFGIKPGMNVAELAHLKWLAPLYDGAKDGHQSEPPRGYQTAVQVFDSGQERFLLPRAVPMIAADKTPIGVTLILVDVTRLRMADEAKSSVVSTVSHELRTPLTSIRMALSLLTDGKFAAKTPQQVTLLTAARQDADRLYRIIENLMNISRLESGRAAFHLRPTSPAELIAQAVDPLRAAFGDKNISLAIDVLDRIGYVLADSAAVGSALTNLLTNALKYSPAGGAVRVSAAGADEFIAFTVSDTGPGIPEQYASQIFDKFFRVPSKEGPMGAGLGLAIAKEVVEAHGGTLILCKPNGPGSEFRFTLRQCNRPAESVAPAASAAGV